MKRILIIVFALLGFAGCFGVAEAAEQDFVKPKAGIFRVDWCYLWGTQCGKPAADRFCQSKGFTQSNNFEEAIDIGAATPTIVLGTGQQCADPSCDGFTFITCEKPDAPPPPPPPGPAPGTGGGDSHTYNNPKIGGAKLNFCFRKGVNCDGQRAADAFCDRKGYDQASDFQQSPPLSPLYPTRYIGNGRICKSLVCFGFSSITCENQ
jgi:hypothetical protein